MNDLKYCKVLVTPTSFGKGDPELKTSLEKAVGRVVYNPTRRPLTSAELAELLPGCDGTLLAWTPSTGLPCSPPAACR